MLGDVGHVEAELVGQHDLVDGLVDALLPGCMWGAPIRWNVPNRIDPSRVAHPGATVSLW